MELTDYHHLKQFKTYVKAKGYDTTVVGSIKTFFKKTKKGIKQITPQDIINFLIYLTEKKMAGNTINGYLNSIRYFYKYAVLVGIVTEAFYSTIIVPSTKKVRTEKRIMPVVTEKDFELIISKIPEVVSSMEPFIARAILYVLFYTGIRKGELLNLCRKDISLESCLLTVRLPNKVKRERIVYFPTFVADFIKSAYMVEDEEYNAFNLTPTRDILFAKELKDMTNKPITYHSFRHGFAHLMVKKGIDPGTLQRLMGHANVTTTLGYFNPTDEDIQEQYRKLTER